MLICSSGCKIRTTCLAETASECADRPVFHGVDAVGPGRDTSRLSETQRPTNSVGEIFQDIDRCGYLINLTFGNRFQERRQPCRDQNKSMRTHRVLPLSSHYLTNLHRHSIKRSAADFLSLLHLTESRLGQIRDDLTHTFVNAQISSVDRVSKLLLHGHWVYHFSIPHIRLRTMREKNWRKMVAQTKYWLTTIYDPASSSVRLYPLV